MFSARFPLCRYMFNIIPKEHIEDIKHVNSSHIELLNYMYSKGLETMLDIMKKDGHVFQTADLSKEVFMGYNSPPSVKHLHIFVVVSPVYVPNPESTFAIWPRSMHHGYAIASLKTHGKVITGDERQDYEAYKIWRTSFLEENKRKWTLLKDTPELFKKYNSNIGEEELAKRVTL